MNTTSQSPVTLINPAKLDQVGPGRVYITATHHSDLAWKWKYDEYADQRAVQFDQIAEWFEKYPNFHFHVEQAELFRVYFESNPEKLPIYKKAFSRGRLTLTGGNSIPDLNLCCGEMFVRCLQRGQKYYRDVFGQQAEIANLNDSFGMHFQIPQILSLAEYKYLSPGRLANAPETISTNDPFIWRGENKTIVVVVNSMFWIDAGSKKQSTPLSHSPVDCQYQSFANIRRSSRNGDILTIYNTETGGFCDDLLPMLEKVNRESGRFAVEFGSMTDYCERIRIDDIPSFTGEFNPTFTGCYTTRSTVKQNVRKAENLLFAAEMLSAGRHLAADLDRAWWELELASFHDAVCGCHHDPVNKQVMSKLKYAQKQAEKVLQRAAPRGPTVFNPARKSGTQLVEVKGAKGLAIKGHSVQQSGESFFFTADLPACGIVSLERGEAREVQGENANPKFSTKFFDVDFSNIYPKITDRRHQRNVFPSDGFGEIFFRLDRGTMWVEALTHHWYGREVQSESVESVTAGPVFYEVVTRGEVLPNSSISEDGSKYSYWDAFKSLHFRKIYRFYRELDYFTLNLEVDWRGNDTKIQIQFPTELNVPETEAVFDTPFGCTVRAPYYEVPKRFESTFKSLSEDSYSTAKGDWPALHWVDYRDKTCALAVANSGTPGHQLVGGNILVSLIRSGTGSRDGLMRPQPGAFDNGHREFEFAFRAHDPADKGDAPALGEVLNRKPVFFQKPGKPHRSKRTSFLSELPENVIISSFRKVDDGIILRVYENSGTAVAWPISSDLRFAEIMESNLLERAWIKCGGTISLEAFEIKTLKLVLESKPA